MDTRERSAEGNHSDTALETAPTGLATPEAVMRHFARFVADGQDRGSVHLFCHAGVPERVLCILELPSRWRTRSDGRGLYEARATLSRAYRAGPAFTCPARLGPRLGVEICSACRGWLEARNLDLQGPLIPGNASRAGQQSKPRSAEVFRFHTPDESRARQPDTRRLVET